MKRIVVGIDGSPCAREAAKVAAELAKGMDAELELCDVVEVFAPLGPEEAQYYDPRDDVANEERSRQLLEEVSRECEARGAKVHTVLVRGEPQAELVRAAQGADLLVVGHRARNVFARRVLGSVADTLAQRSPCPVLIVREHAQQHATA